jgi:ABC-type antimicrobial peptide transport system permease subunit
MRDLLAASTARTKIAATLLALLGTLSLILALAGVYAVVAYSVRQRTRELGIRIALGAQAGDIARMVVASGLRLALAGVGLGWLGALILARGLSGLLFQVAPLDATAFLGAAVLVAGSAVLASHLPARRAARTDPLPALSSE